jgi:hypothetical protein
MPKWLILILKLGKFINRIYLLSKNNFIQKYKFNENNLLFIFIMKIIIF